MSTKNIQNYTDAIIEKIFFRFIPDNIKPNHFTVIRIVLVPVTFFLLSRHLYLAAFILFIIAASTDFIDGALARKRNQITELGKVIDPLADKMLIAATLLFIGVNYLIVKIFLVFIVGEVIAILGSVALSKYLGKPIGANIFGKIKMILQSFAIVSFLFGIILKHDFLIKSSFLLLITALIFAVLAGFLTALRKLSQLRNEKIIP